MDWTSWSSLPLTARAGLPPQPGIYIVVDAAAQVWYVGRSINLYARWNGKGHHRYRQLSRTNKQRFYRIHWQLYPPEQLAAQEQHYINFLKPHLNYSRVKTYARRATQPHQELSRLFKVINQKTMLFPNVRSVVLGYYTELDEDETGALKEYTCVVTAVNVNDHDRVILKSIDKSLSKKGISLKDCWGVYEANCGDNSPDAKPVTVPVFLSGDVAYEFVCYYRLLDQLEQHRANLYTVELANQPVSALRELNTLTALLTADLPRMSHEFYLHYRATDLCPIAELLEMPTL